MVQKAPPERQGNMGKAALDLVSKLPAQQGKSVTGAEIQELAKSSGSSGKKAGEVNGLRLLQHALKDKSIYHGIKNEDGRNMLWQEIFKGPKEAADVRNAMVDRRVAKGAATPEEKMEYDLRMNAKKDPMEQMMETLRLLGKLPNKP